MHKKYILRANEEFIFDSFKRSSISALLGPRRVGKTTLVNYYISLHSDKKWVRLNMDSLNQRQRVAKEELKLMIEQEALQKIGGIKKIWVFIDEAQKSPELFDQVKLIYDEFKDQDQIKFILTGSAHFNLHKLTAESLAGRVELLHLREFNLREMICLLQPDLTMTTQSSLGTLFSFDKKNLQEVYSDLRPFQKQFESSLEMHLLWGGLPETFREQSEKCYLKYLGDYLQTYLERDILAIETINDLNLFQNLMKISAEQTGSLKDDKKITEALHCSRNTLDKYRNYLKATLQYIEVYPYIDSSIKRLVKSPKGYLSNNGLISYLTGIYDASILKTTGLIGHRFENWFLNEIETYLDTTSERHTIAFWRTSGGSEVDFVVSLGNQVIPFEITYSTQVDSRKINHLKTFLQQSEKSAYGVLCYLGPLSYDEKYRILFLPAWMI